MGSQRLSPFYPPSQTFFPRPIYSAPSSVFQEQEAFRTSFRVSERVRDAGTDAGVRADADADAGADASPKVCAGLLYRTCSLQQLNVQVPAPCRGSSCRNGNKDPMHRARRAPRPFPPCAISVAIISAKSDTMVKPHAIYHNARRVTRLPPPLAAWLFRRSRSPPRRQVYNIAQQMRSFDVILHPAN